METSEISPHDKCGWISDSSISVMWRNLKFLHLTDVNFFRFLYICHVNKSEISPHNRFVLHISHLWYLWQISGIWSFNVIQFLFRFIGFRFSVSSVVKASLTIHCSSYNLNHSVLLWSLYTPCNGDNKYVQLSVQNCIIGEEKWVLKEIKM